jgi:putative ABC transport system permease protein
MFARFRSFWRAALGRSRFERDMDDELAFHLERRTDDLVKAGLPREQAARAARAQFGNPEVWQERCRDSKRLHILDDARQDVRFAFRSLSRDRLLALTILATLALGIGATTAFFSIVDAVLLRPLPFPYAGRLMMLSSVRDNGELSTVFGPDYTAWLERCHNCEDVAAFSGTSAGNFSGGSAPVRIPIGHVTANLFATLGVQPVLGRTFLPDETGRAFIGSSEQTTSITAVVISHGLWQRVFGGDPGVIGKMVTVDGDRCTVVGVMPEGFTFPNRADAWVPATINVRRDNAYLQVVARLRPGVTREAANAEVQAITTDVDRQQAAGSAKTIVAVTPLQQFITGDMRAPLLTFLGAIGFVLLIACANVANLLLARGATRPKELAIRAALGASRARVIRQLITESLVFALAGGALGLVLAAWLTRAFVAFAPGAIPRLNEVGLDGRVLAFTALLSLATGVLFGLGPAFRGSRTELNAALQEGGARVAGSVARNRLRRLLVAAEVALALVLLIGSGLLVKSFVELRQTPLGFDPSGTMTASLTLPDAEYPTVARMQAYYAAALQRLEALPDVRAVGIVSAAPLHRTGARVSGGIAVEGEPTERDITTRKIAISGGYFRAAGIPLLKGRTFDDRDTAASAKVLIVSESLANTLWPNQNPIGRRLNIGFGGEQGILREVVGVVADVKHDAIEEPSLSALYQPYQQVIERQRWRVSEMTFIVRTANAPQAVASALRATLAQIDPALPVYSVASTVDVVAMRTADPRFYTLLLGSFALLALALAVAGIYGVIAFSVSQRTHELSIRMALGASARNVIGLILADGMAPVVAGTLLGLLGAFALTRTLSRFLYQVSVTDTSTFLAICLLLTMVGLLACYVPARRATRLDPVEALRRE